MEGMAQRQGCALSFQVSASTVWERCVPEEDVAIFCHDAFAVNPELGHIVEVHSEYSTQRLYRQDCH